MATMRLVIQKAVKEIRRSTGGCVGCGKIPPHGLMLADPGPTFSELVRTPGITLQEIHDITKERGLVCRKCLNKSTGVSDAGASNPESRDTPELLNDPDVRRMMFEKGISIVQEFLDRGIPQIGPEDGGGGDSHGEIMEGSGNVFADLGVAEPNEDLRDAAERYRAGSGNL